jgi:hypothetical protein
MRIHTNCKSKGLAAQGSAVPPRSIGRRGWTCGDGFEWYRHVRIPADEPPPPAPSQPAEDELDLDREIEYAFEAEKTMGGRPPAGDVE